MLNWALFLKEFIFTVFEHLTCANYNKSTFQDNVIPLYDSVIVPLKIYAELSRLYILAYIKDVLFIQLVTQHSSVEVTSIFVKSCMRGFM